MRTTLTIEDDVAAELERLRRSRNMKLKNLVNEVLRRGLQDITASPKKQKPFRTRSFDAGRVLVTNIDNIGELLAEVEGEWYR
jgi:hypothetical protein